MDHLTSFYASLFLWFFLPTYATRFLLHLLHALIYRRQPRPARSSTTYQRQFRYLLTCLMCSYMVYEFVGFSSFEATPTPSDLAHIDDGFPLRFNSSSSNWNFHRLFGLQPDPTTFDTTALKKQFRSFSRQLHPDKNPSAEAERVFERIRQGYDILLHPHRRWLYNRWGVQAVSECSHCKTLNEYIVQALSQQTVPFYASWILALLVIPWLQGFSLSAKKPSGPNVYWPLVGLVGLLTLELKLELSDQLEVQTLLKGWGWTPYQWILFARHVFIVSMVAWNQLMPVWTSNGQMTLEARVLSGEDSDALRQALLDEMDQAQDLMEEELAFQTHWIQEAFQEEQEEAEDLLGGTGVVGVDEVKLEAKQELKTNSWMQRLMKKAHEIETELQLLEQYPEYAEAYRKARLVHERQNSNEHQALLLKQKKEE